tara:strand:+ start:3202 stop:4119 length:918 start_codon:yes stop_codon:yes gene_type:complete
MTSWKDSSGRKNNKSLFQNKLKTLSKNFLYTNLKRLRIKKTDTIYLGLDLKNFYIPFLKLLNKDPNLFDKNILSKIFYKNLKEYFLPNGTVIFQAFTWSFIKNKKFHPRFNSPDIGSFEKYLFNKPGVARSSHPTNSIIVFGKNKKLVSKNHGLYSFGANSPFEKFKDLNLKFVNIGVPLENSCTYLHHLEHINGTNHRFNKLINGKVFVNNRYLRKNFYILVKYKNISSAVERNEKKFFDYLKKRDKLKSLKVNHVLFSVINCQDVYNSGLSFLKDDSSYFMKKKIFVKFSEKIKKIKKNYYIF